MDVGALAYDGIPAPLLAERLGVPQIALYATVGSTLDVAHGLAERGAPGGTLVLADRQEAGRGRMGRPWASPAGCGIWLAYLVRLAGSADPGVLALRAGLAVADACAALGAETTLKWPNDVLLGGRKLAGILCEVRAAGTAWVAVGVGLNVTASPQSVAGEAAALVTAVPQADRVGVLTALVPRLARLDLARVLTAEERTAWTRRDALAGRDLVAPVRGRVRGLAADGALLVATDGGEQRVLGGTVICS